MIHEITDSNSERAPEGEVSDVEATVPVHYFDGDRPAVGMAAVCGFVMSSRPAGNSVVRVAPFPVDGPAPQRITVRCPDCVRVLAERALEESAGVSECQWCHTPKDNPHGMCSACGRFPPTPRTPDDELEYLEQPIPVPDPGILRFATRSSWYEVDLREQRIRRTLGVNPPTPNQGADGEWQGYLKISEIQVGRPVVILWHMGSNGATITSDVTEIKP